MNSKEAKARIKINKLLEQAGWRFFDDENGRQNIYLEPSCKIKIKQSDLDDFGDDFEKTKTGFIDYLLVDDKNNPLIVLEAKKSSVEPLNAKEQARDYALSVGAKYIILSNGDVHYFWILKPNYNPEIITAFPSLESLIESKALNSNLDAIFDLPIDKYFIASSQEPSIENTEMWKNKNENELARYCKENDLRVLRYYQLNAIKSVQDALKNKSTRFLFEMATGTGKTLTAAGVIKMFIRSEIANRVLFLVDRIELENQAENDLKSYLAKDGIKIVIYKENKDEWMSADVVISTIQTLSYNNNYKNIFRPSDFDLVISDEAHRVLGASNRAIFEYFIGYKLGLTATPKNYLRGVNMDEVNPSELERRMLLDTYRIFGCDNGSPTFSYTLTDGVKDKILVNPIVVDARSSITTKLLSDNGLTVTSDDDNYEIKYLDEKDNSKKTFNIKSFEKEFFSESTNEIFCKVFLENALKDPITNEIGKTIFFCVNIQHAAKITQILNVLASKMYPNMYSSDFAVQITSNIEKSQDMTISFANNNLNGNSLFMDDYTTSKTRVAVTVGMMTTGYDCKDILNICFCRPVFSPSEFIQMKGRGTRIFDFKNDDVIIKKQNFKLFDFFGVCENFEENYNYDIKLNLPKENINIDSFVEPKKQISKVINKSEDDLETLNETKILASGMKIDRDYYNSFSTKVENDESIKKYKLEKDVEGLMNYLQNEVFNKPLEYYSLDKIERALNLNRHLTLREVAKNIINSILGFKNRSEILDDEFDNFVLINKNELDKIPESVPALRELFVAYLVDTEIRDSIKNKRYQNIINSPLNNSLKMIKDVKIKNMSVLDYIPYYVTTNSINCERFYA